MRRIYVAKVRASLNDPPRSEKANGPDISGILDAISNEVARECSAICDGINAEFAARAEHARKYLPRHRVVSTISALNLERQAKLRQARDEAEAKRHSRQKEAISQVPREPNRPEWNQNNLSGPRPR